MSLKDCKHCSEEGICTKMTSIKERKYPDKPYHCGVTNPKDCVLYERKD